MTRRRRTRLHRGSPRRRKRRSRKPRHKATGTSPGMASMESVVMMLNVERIESRDRFADEMHALSGLVRRDGQQYGTPINRLDAPQAPLPARLMDFVSLTKPEVLLLVLIATGAGYLMASTSLDPLILFNAVLGTALVAGGTAALNHYAERTFDGKMRRTANRPLPAGRLTPQSALRFGIALSIIGTLYLAVTCNLL